MFAFADISHTVLRYKLTDDCLIDTYCFYIVYFTITSNLYIFDR